MMDIDKLNRDELINFLSHSYNVADFQESHSDEYQKLINDITNKAYSSYTEDKLASTYPEIAEKLNENEEITSLQSQINQIDSLPSKKKVRIWKPIKKPLIWSTVVLVILYAIGSMLSNFAYNNASIYSLYHSIIDLCSVIFSVIFYGLIGYLIYVYFKNRKISRNQYERDRERTPLIYKRNELAQEEISKFADKTQEAKKYMENWTNELEQLPSEDLDCFSILSNVDEAYCNTRLISKMIELLRQHRSHDFESTINLIVSEVKQEEAQNENRNMINSVSNDVKQMENNLHDLGQQALNKLDQNNDLAQQAATSADKTTRAINDLASDAYKEAHKLIWGGSNNNRNRKYEDRISNLERKVDK